MCFGCLLPPCFASPVSPPFSPRLWCPWLLVSPSFFPLVSHCSPLWLLVVGRVAAPLGFCVGAPFSSRSFLSACFFVALLLLGLGGFFFGLLARGGFFSFVSVLGRWVFGFFLFFFFFLLVGCGVHFVLLPCGALRGGLALLVVGLGVLCVAGGVSLTCCLQVLPASRTFLFHGFQPTRSVTLVIHSGSVPVVCTFGSPGQGCCVTPRGWDVMWQNH